MVETRSPDKLIDADANFGEESKRFASASEALFAELHLVNARSFVNLADSPTNAKVFFPAARIDNNGSLIFAADDSGLGKTSPLFEAEEDDLGRGDAGSKRETTGNNETELEENARKYLSNSRGLDAKSERKKFLEDVQTFKVNASGRLSEAQIESVFASVNRLFEANSGKIPEQLRRQLAVQIMLSLIHI